MGFSDLFGVGMKKFGYILYGAVFFALISAPLVFMPWAGYQLMENRPPAPVPGIINDGSLNLDLPGEVEDYFMDRFAGRVQMVDAYSRVVGSLFGVSANEKVVMGQDGWLFFQETVGDYDGSAALSDEEMDSLIQYLLEIKSAAEERGQVFIIAIVPNKNTIYSEHMPSRYIRTDRATNLDRLMAVEGLDCIDLRAALLTSDQSVYYKTDTHWNGLGARIAAHEIMLAIEAGTGVRAELDWDDGSYEEILITGDLGRMLYPANPPEEADRIFENAMHRFRTVGRFRSFDDLHITTESDGAFLRVAMYRDSFADALIPYFSNAYSNVYYTRQTPPPFESVAFLEADVIVLQIVERRLGEML